MAQEQLTQIVNLIARAEKAERERDEARDDAESCRQTAIASRDEYATYRVSTRGLIARAVEAIEQARTFADLQRRHRATDCTCASCRRENDYVDSLAALVADLRKAGEGA